ncbi:MAG: radical SAM protein [Planctomycetota bacterium]
MVRYEGVVIRPPSEADSLILQVTLGCSHNKCIFCGAYLDKKFRKRPIEEVFEDIDSAGHYRNQIRRVFLADGNALILPVRHLDAILDKLNSAFPNLNRVGIYANATDVTKKNVKDLARFREKKLSIYYLGLESGSDKVLELVNKGATSGDMIECVKRAHEADVKMSVICLLGVGGKKFSEDHVRETAKVLNEMQPRFVSFLTLMIIEETPLDKMIQSGEFELPSPYETLVELRDIVEKLDLKSSILRTNHASNFLAIGGTLPKDKEKILSDINRCLKGEIGLRPEFLRGL